MWERGLRARVEVSVSVPTLCTRAVLRVNAGFLHVVVWRVKCELSRLGEKKIEKKTQLKKCFSIDRTKQSRRSLG